MIYKYLNIFKNLYLQFSTCIFVYRKSHNTVMKVVLLNNELSFEVETKGEFKKFNVDVFTSQLYIFKLSFQADWTFIFIVVVEFFFNNICKSICAIMFLEKTQWKSNFLYSGSDFLG